VHNAGTSLISPYLPLLFNRLNLTEKGKFKSTEAQIRAIFLIQYAVFGIASSQNETETTTIESPETELTLNKLLTGFPAETPIPGRYDLKKEETETVNSMLQGILANWDKLKNSSLSALREGFLQREGKLEEHVNSFLLIVEEKSYDLLLDACPWNFRTIKFPWMQKVINIKWR